MRDDPEFQTVTLHRDELDVRLWPLVRRAWEFARDLCLKENGEVAYRVDQVVLAGNASRYPLVEEVLKEVFAGNEQPFAYQKHKVLPAGPQAKLAVAKGAAIALLYELQRPNDFVWPDQELVSFEINPHPVLPYTIYLESNLEKRPVFKRGTKFPEPASKGAAAPPLSDAFAVSDIVTLWQGLKDAGVREMKQFNTLDCKEASTRRPPGMPADAVEKLVLEVDREYDVRARLEWRSKDNDVLGSAEVNMGPPQPDADAESKDPYSGQH